MKQLLSAGILLVSSPALAEWGSICDPNEERATPEWNIVKNYPDGQYRFRFRAKMSASWKHQSRSQCLLETTWKL